jgi:hypothetical protein
MKIGVCEAVPCSEVDETFVNENVMFTEKKFVAVVNSNNDSENKTMIEN